MRSTVIRDIQKACVAVLSPIKSCPEAIGAYFVCLENMEVTSNRIMALKRYFSIQRYKCEPDLSLFTRVHSRNFSRIEDSGKVKFEPFWNFYRISVLSVQNYSLCEK